MTLTWRDEAACSGLDTEMFYAHEGHANPRVRDGAARHAFAVCRACDVRPHCLITGCPFEHPTHEPKET